MFSAKCSIMLQEHNIKIDWSRGDLELRQMVCAGSTVNMCNFCSSTLHKSSMCGKSRGYQNSKIQPTQDKYGRDIVVHDGMQICNNFNQPKGCVKPYCRYAHVINIMDSDNIKTDDHEHDENGLNTSGSELVQYKPDVLPDLFDLASLTKDDEDVISNSLGDVGDIPQMQKTFTQQHVPADDLD
ncbi:unnamed protein product [Mytilus edulis]|uniref:C3H1-type domain-containing protein n=1 Tax=Mytilus edulis TaxID=6550 RepID=A0A8S3VJL4_MYTED|nr:unnamed protein product [Mytilus edulis]